MNYTGQPAGNHIHNSGSSKANSSKAVGSSSSPSSAGRQTGLIKSQTTTTTTTILQTIGGLSQGQLPVQSPGGAGSAASSLAPCELEDFAERFKQRRIKLGVTQADVGKALATLQLPGVGSLSQSTICRFESLTLSHNNMIALRPILQAWLETAENQSRQARSIQHQHQHQHQPGANPLTAQQPTHEHLTIVSKQQQQQQPQAPIWRTAMEAPPTTGSRARKSPVGHEQTVSAAAAAATQATASSGGQSSKQRDSSSGNIICGPPTLHLATEDRQDSVANNSTTAAQATLQSELHFCPRDRAQARIGDDDRLVLATSKVESATNNNDDEDSMSNASNATSDTGSASASSGNKRLKMSTGSAGSIVGPESMSDADKANRRASIAARERRLLEAHFEQIARPNSDQLQTIAERLDMDKSTVRVWFCNQRQKQKRLRYSTNGTSGSGISAGAQHTAPQSPLSSDEGNSDIVNRSEGSAIGQSQY